MQPDPPDFFSTPALRSARAPNEWDGATLRARLVVKPGDRPEVQIEVPRGGLEFAPASTAELVFADGSIRRGKVCSRPDDGRYAEGLMLPVEIWRADDLPVNALVSVKLRLGAREVVVAARDSEADAADERELDDELAALKTKMGNEP